MSTFNFKVRTEIVLLSLLKDAITEKVPVLGYLQTQF